MAESLELLSRYIGFDTSHQNELEAAQWLAGQLRDRRITDDVVVHEPAPGRGLVVARIAGSEPLKPLLVNHHIDVVVADPGPWSHPPFAGEIMDGVVHGRGALDDKGMGIALLLALEQLLAEGMRFRRPLVYIAVPDEEATGAAGTGWLVSHLCRDLDPEWAWDEGGAGFVEMFGPRTFFGLGTCEKQVHQVRIRAEGTPGHGAMPHGDNPNAKLVAALGRVLARPRPIWLSETTRAMLASISADQRPGENDVLPGLDSGVVVRLPRRFAGDPMLNAFLRDTVSLTVLRGGEQGNVIPASAEALLDCRLLPETDPAEFDAWLQGRLGKGVTIEVISRTPRTPISPMDSPLYAALREAALRAVPHASVFPLQMAGATDGSFWRDCGVPTYSMAPFLMTREDLASIHGIDERISGENLALGIRIAKDVIRAVCA